MEHANKVYPSEFIAPYITSCYGESRYCELFLVCAQNRVVSCHQLVLCSLSKKMLSICRDIDQEGEVTYIHLQDFSYEDVKDTVDMIYASLGKQRVKIDNNEVTSVLGIEDTAIEPQVKKELYDPSLKVYHIS